MARFINSAQIYVETVTVVLPNTPVQATSATVPEGQTVVFKAHPSNTGYIKIADTGAKASASIGEGNVPLSAGEAVSYQISNASIPYIDATEANQKVIVTMEF